MKIALSIFGLVVALIIGCMAGGIAVLSQGLPEVMALEDFTPPSSTIIYGADSSVIAEFAVEKRKPVDLEKMPRHLIDAVISIEDHKYFDHIGINVMRIAKALVVDIMAGRAKQGGSTITQQLAKVLFLSPKKTIERKVREAILAFEIEKLYTKEEILELYLNQIYLGNGAYGVAAAAEAYFGKDLSELELHECALIAALPNGPTRFNPFRNPDNATRRRNLVIKRMRTLEWITEEEAEKAMAMPLPEPPEESQVKTAPYFVEAVRKELVDKFGSEMVFQGGLRVYTTLDPHLQKSAEKALASGIETIEKRNPSKKERDPVQGALIAIDTRTGAVLSQIGGTDWETTQYDRSMQARRQMGSTFKPVIFASAIESGMSQGETILDSPAKYRGASPGTPWQPQNYDRKFLGQITLRKALALSRNLPAIKLLEELTLPKVEATAKRLGLTNAMGEGLATALGVGSATLEETTAAYASFVAGGMRPTPYRIRAVFGPGGNNLWADPPAPRRAIDPTSAFVVSDMLRAVVESGTGKQARALPFRVGGKTGTTDDQRDASFVGFSSRVALGVWVGRDDNSPIGLGETGSRAALPIWVDVMLATTKRIIPTPWPAPKDVVISEIDLASGELASPECEETSFAAFARDNAPKEVCDRERFGWSHLLSQYTFKNLTGDTP